MFVSGWPNMDSRKIAKKEQVQRKWKEVSGSMKQRGQSGEMFLSILDLNEFKWEWPDNTWVRSRIVLVLEVLKSFGSVLELAMRWMNDLSLFVAFDCEVMFLMAIFLRSFSFRLTCDNLSRMIRRNSTFGHI